MKALMPTTAACLLAGVLLAACGGGGGEGDVGSVPPAGGSPSTPVATYGDSTLPGHLIVESSIGPAMAYDLRTGRGQALPASTSDSSEWYSGSHPGVILRADFGPGKRLMALHTVRTSDWTTLRTTAIEGSISQPKLSPDGRHLLGFWEPAGESDSYRLTVFDVETGQIVKQGSALDGEIVIGNPADWLPDGRYIYLAGRQLYESSPQSSSSTLRATLSALPDNSFSQNDIDLDSNFTHLKVSPDGTRFTFAWRTHRRNVTGDWNLWVADVNGSDLRQLTFPTDPLSPLDHAYVSPVWSPDSQWIAGILDMGGGVVVAPIFPPDQSFPGVPGGIIGATGCANQVFVLPVDADKVSISWPTFDARYGVKVLNKDGTGGAWLSSCSPIHWVN